MRREVSSKVRRPTFLFSLCPMRRGDERKRSISQIAREQKRNTKGIGVKFWSRALS